MDIAKKIFQFLKEFNKLKTRPQLDVSSFEKVLWFYDIPIEKECYSIIQNSNFDSVNFDKLIEVKKSKRKPFPEPPEAIIPWLKENTLNEHTIQPQLHSYIIPESSNQNPLMSSEEEHNERILLEDCPKVQQTFKNYLNKEWLTWSKEEKRLLPVLEVYNNLYKIYKKNKDQGEIYQIVLGLGLLSSKNKNGSIIKRHIIEVPLTIKFHTVTGTITVEPCEQSAELSLEMDMFHDSERPEISDNIHSQLSELNNDFWKDEKFYNCLKSWLNSYDPEGQFSKSNKPSSVGSFSTITISPAIILRKRNEKAFTNFYSEVIKDVENKENLSPCLSNLLNRNETLKQGEYLLQDSLKKHLTIEKHYFPLPVNEEQENIIKKISNNNQVVVQGPPGTGKTHSIANLICHFLATGQKILVTSQTDRALKVLREKLPKKMQQLCVEILGKDQESLQELKNSFSAINSEHQIWDDETNCKTIHNLEEKDNDLKGKLATIESRLINIKKFESEKYEKQFSFYTGSPAVISTRVKNEEEKYSWIKEEFDSDGECPISNDEAESFFTSIKSLRNIEDSILEESIEFSDKILTLQALEEKIKTEKEMKKITEKYKFYKEKKEASFYKDLPDNDLDQLKNAIISIYSKAESLLNRDEQWVKRALKDCLADRDREWRYLYTSTHDILDKNKNMFSEAEKITEIKINSKIPSSDLYLTNLLRDFFNKYKPNDQIRWGLFCSKTIRDLKKIKIDEKNISSYRDAKLFENYIQAKRSLEKINNFWESQAINTKKTQCRNFMKNYHVFKDFCEPLDECLSIHKLVENIKHILAHYNIPQFQWTIDSIKKEMKIIEFIQARRTLKKIEIDFERAVSALELYRNQKNQIAKKIISSYEERNLKDYKDILNQISDFKDKKKEFSKICKINTKLNNNKLYLKIKKDIDNSIWLSNLKFFKEAWEWKRADQWLKEKTSENFLKELNQDRDDLLKKQKQNMELLASKKAWRFCLSQIKNEELSSLKGWIQAISKIGKGTGITASKHRKVAKKRMEECKTTIPAWIMPLYRVVENIKPNAEPFDIAIIDEASQTGPDGFLLNYLAKKIIVVGDKEQISPENPGIKDEDVEIIKKKYLSDIKYSEHIGREYSYYDYCETLFTGSHVQLREHFRCMPEIIQFSNNISYSGTPLIPLRQYGSSRLSPLKTTYVNEAISKIGNGREPQNEKEAEAIVNQIKECINDPAYEGKTFGIIVLQGKSQIQVIEKALTEIDKTEIEKRAIHVGNAYSFQGDERDVIFLSMAISNDWLGGRIRSLTRETYKKQYNVAASRAKDQMWLFHSIGLNDLSTQDFRRQLLSHCVSDTKKMTVWPYNKLNEIYTKIKETKNKSPDNAPEHFDSWFEARVFHKIARKGYTVIPQYKVSNYLIDMIIIGSNGRLAVECDGDYWHSSEQAEQQDLERQWRLERCGWTFWRLRESIFNRNEEKALSSLWKLLDEMQIYPLRSDENIADDLTNANIKKVV